MAFSFRKDNFFKSKSIAGIECTADEKGDVVFRVASLKKSGNRAEFISSSESKSIDELSTQFKTDVPAILIINGKGIIHRKVSSEFLENDLVVLQRVLPNAELKDFYIEKHSNQSKTGQVYVSVARKTLVEKVLADFKKKGIHIIACSLGPFVLKNIFPFLTASENFEATICDYHFTVENNLITDYRQKEITGQLPSLNIAGTMVPQEFTIAFAAALQYFVSGERSFLLELHSVKKVQEEFNQKLLFEKAGWGMLIFFLSLLMINFFLFQHYSSNNSEINAQLLSLQNEVSNYKKLEKDFESKKEFLERNGLLQTSKTSYYADQLAIDLPNVIKLTSMNICPVVKIIDSREESALSFNNKKITVSGTCRLSTEVNEWMKIIKAKKWVHGVKMIDYKQEDLRSSGEFIIELEII